MLYLANPSTQRVRDAMTAGLVGCIDSPPQGNRPVPGAWWAGDNAVYGKGWPGEQAWWAWVRQRVQVEPERCLFVVAPDVVADAAATLARSRPWLHRVRALGVPVAFVIQDGAEAPGMVPWGEFDVLFIGGSTDWKLGPEAAALVREALARGLRVHMGRVNSARRYAYAQLLGCHTCDGTYVAFGPDENLPKVIRWGDDLLSLLNGEAGS